MGVIRFRVFLWEIVGRVGIEGMIDGMVVKDLRGFVIR